MKRIKGFICNWYARRKSSSSNTELGSGQFDYSKSTAVVRLDLLIKAMSAIAIVAIGVVTYRFQSQSEGARAAEAQRQVEEQRYLPLFRGISEVDLALGEISAEFGEPSYTSVQALREKRLGASLSFLADSLYFPVEDPKVGEPNEPKMRLLTAPDNANGTKGAREIELKVEEAVRLLGTVLSLEPMLRRKSKTPHLMIRVAEGSLIFETENLVRVDEVPLDARVFPAFEKWLPGQMEVDDLYSYVDVDTIADDIAGQLMLIAKDQLKQHPQLADKYVVIRNDVIRGRQELLPH
jgi:hypothetical protein